MFSTTVSPSTEKPHCSQFVFEVDWCVLWLIVKYHEKWLTICKVNKSHLLQFTDNVRPRVLRAGCRGGTRRSPPYRTVQCSAVLYTIREGNTCPTETLYCRAQTVAAAVAPAAKMTKHILINCINLVYWCTWYLCSAVWAGWERARPELFRLRVARWWTGGGM